MEGARDMCCRKEPRLKREAQESPFLILASQGTLLSIHSLFSIHVGKDDDPTVPKFLSPLL